MNGKIKISLFSTLIAFLLTQTPYANGADNPIDKRIDGPIIARNQDLQTILMILQSESGVQFILDENVNKKVTFNLNSPTVRQILNTVLPTVGLDYKDVGDNVYRIGNNDSLQKAQEPFFTIGEVELSPNVKKALDTKIDGPVLARTQDLWTVLSLLQQNCGVPMILAGDPDMKVTFNFQSPTVGDVLNTIAPSAGFAYIGTGDDMLLIGTPQSLKNGRQLFQTLRSNKIKPPLKKALDKKLDGPVKSHNQDVRIILSLLQQESGIYTILAEGVDSKVTFNLPSPTVRQVFFAALASANLNCTVDADTLRVDRYKEGPGALIGGLSTIPGLKNKIDGPVVVKNQSIHSILSLLQSVGKIQFTLEKDLSANVSFSLTDPTVGDVLEAILKETGFECTAENAGIIMLRKPKTN